jgi:serine/threonine protein kinase
MKDRAGDRMGQQLGNYRLIHLLGHGGFAEVYLGEHVYLKSPAAIKVLYTLLGPDESESFLNEARTLVRLIHPHIVRVLDFGIDGNTPFLVIDYAPNGTLRQRHPRGTRLPLATIVDYVKQVADALQYAHNEKLVHRDIKPENMLLGRHNEILLSDFGIAIVAQSSRNQGAQDMAGTIAYMAPEQISAHPRPASDQYALGIVVYEWLSGDRPFQGSFTEIAVKQAMVPPPPLRERFPDIPLDVERVVLTALEKDPQKRFVNVWAFAQALEQASLPALAYPSDLPTVITSPGQSSRPGVVISPPSHPSQATSFTPPGQWPQASNIGFPPVQPREVPVVSRPSYTPDVLPPISMTIPGTAEKVQPVRRGSSRIVLIISLVGLFLIVFGIAGFVLAQRLQAGSLAGPTATSVPAITATFTPTPTPIVYPDIAGHYSGTIHNTRVDVNSTMTLSINQDQGNISGDFTVASPLLGSGPFTGTINTAKYLKFIVHSNEVTAPILFWGTVQADGGLKGEYCSVNQQTQCDSQAGGNGTWDVSKAQYSAIKNAQLIMPRG